MTEILAGIYYMRPSMLDLIPDGTHFGMNQLIEKMLREKRLVARYLVREYWLDIGCIDDFSEAEQAYREHF